MHATHGKTYVNYNCDLVDNYEPQTLIKLVRVSPKYPRTHHQMEFLPTMHYICLESVVSNSSFVYGWMLDKFHNIV